ncbi:MAG: Fic family protein [Thaumarchaeota archaeon]|nr:Fic family protein [Nitrososphaerota archaeon]
MPINHPLYKKMEEMQIHYLEKSFVIELNKKIIMEWNERHPELPEYIAESGSGLDEVLSTVEKTGNDEVDHEDKIITKAAHLLGGIPWAQSFSGANKRTAILATTIFLRRNGLSIKFPPVEQRELRQLLFRIQEERGKLQPEIIDRLILYIRKNTKSL